MKTVERALASVGKAVFIENYEMFKYWRDKDKMVECLRNKGTGSSDKARRTRVNNAIWIFESGHELSALLLILKSDRLPDYVQELAEFEYDRLINPPQSNSNIRSIAPADLGKVIMEDLRRSQGV